ncbi:MAG: hypothetical protein Q8P07_04535 [bacterium]|nr:hypothetical protein [bacterium]
MHIRTWIFVGVVVLAAIYFFYEASGVIFSPDLKIFEPENGATLNTTQMHIAGQTIPGLKVWVGGREFTANDKGIFEGIVPLSPGYNEIGISVKDRFGAETQKILKVFVK